MRKENDYQAKLIKKIKKKFPGCFVLKNDSSYIQGIPDLSIFYEDKWAVLEVKRSSKETYRPNQEYYLDKLNRLSFARTIYPENEEEILNELQATFKS